MTTAERPSRPVFSVVNERRNGPLLAEVARLWIRPGDLVVDVTYGRGRWWTSLDHDVRGHDLALDGVDFRRLPYGDETWDVVAFDPPYIAQGGRTTSTTPEFLARYGLVDVPKTVAELDRLIAEGIGEAARVLAPGGRLLAKCMDYISGGRYVQGRRRVVEAAEGAGLVLVDEFVHASGTGPQPARPRQVHSRRAHSFLEVLQKPPVWR